jgi:two-component system, NtrC family, nitrogen regulation sensor histidine kinase NtrY
VTSPLKDDHECNRKNTINLSIIHHIKKAKILVLLSFMLLIVAMSIDKYYCSYAYRIHLFRNFQKQVLKQQAIMKDDLIVLSKLLLPQGINESFYKNSKILSDKAESQYTYYFIYRNDSMFYWSDNRIPEAEILPAILRDNQFLQLSNGWFLSHSIEIADYKIIVLTLIKNNFILKNKFFDSRFNPIFDMPDEVVPKPRSASDRYQITDIYGNHLFSITLEKLSLTSSSGNILTIILFAFSFVLLMIGIGQIIQKFKSSTGKFLTIIIAGTILIVLKYFMFKYKFPGFIYNLGLFQPIHFALSNLIPSLGDMLIFSLILFFLVFYLYKLVDFSNLNIYKNRLLKYFFPITLLVSVQLYFLFINELFENIIYNARIYLNTQEIINLGNLYLFAFLSMALLYLVLIYLTDLIFKFFYKEFNFKFSIFLSCSIAAIIFIINGFIKKDYDPASILLILSLYILIGYIRKHKNTTYRYAYLVSFVLIFTIYSIVLIFQVTEQKLGNEKRVLASNLSSEHDPVAEYLIHDMGTNLGSDTLIKRLSLQNKIDYPWIYRYIRKRYFSGYWVRYDLQVTICKSSDSVLIKPENMYQPCFNFFNTLLSHSAELVKGTKFYFLKNTNGRISYFSPMYYNDSISKRSTSLYLQLDSKILTENLGYPELLIDDRFASDNRKLGYSYAKYYRGKLISQSGTFPYNLSLNSYPISKTDYFFTNFEGYDHLFYKHDKDNLLILSRPSIKFFDILVIFSYLFIFNFIILQLVIIYTNPERIRLELKSNLKTKIRLSIIIILSLSLLSIGSITVYYVIKQYRSRHNEVVAEKMQSVYFELESRLSQEKVIDYNWSSYEFSNLEELLRKLSNFFNTDINLYDKNGRMIASSRPEIFDKGLVGNYMNPKAYYQLVQLNKAEYIQNEQIGTLKYTSVYQPFINDENKLTAYLNLPYFTRENALKQRISSMLLPIFNFYVLLVLMSFSFAVFISQQLTRPLKSLQDKFASIKLGIKSEKLIYKDKDEIGDLVEEYNRMVDELEHSVEMLARSERETAWREMAKQVAHEIKNPLTPMKLSIQQLQRAWNDKKENLDEYFIRVTKTLTEQIDNLSNIATEFSNFAQMPKTQNEKLELVDILRNVLNLFNEDRVSFELEYEKDQKYVVTADKEQISRVFINLLTNAIQAIPANKPGKILISVNSDKKNLTISVSDNGSGIEDELLDKLFQPNFTTKSSGMGLGLAISKSIIESTGGNITFTTLLNKGTTFYITLPQTV